MAANELEVTINLGDLTHVKGQLETMMVVVGMMAEKYPQHLIGQFISECVELKQYDELNRKKQRGLHYMDAVIGDRFGDMVDLLAAKEMDYQLQQNPELRTWKDGDPMITGTVEITDRLPDDTYTGQDGSRGTLKKAETVTAGKTGRKNGPGVKTAEKIRKATNEPVKKAGATRKTTAKKASGAADAK